jgi:hypothetical protein
MRALRALNEAYSRGIAHVHTFLPETHALFQPPPSPRSSGEGSRASTIGPLAAGPAGDRIRDRERRDSAGSSFGNAAGLGAGAAVTQPQPHPQSLLPLSLPPAELTMPTPQVAPSPTSAPPSYGYGFTDGKQPVFPEKPGLGLERTASSDRRAQPSPLGRSHTPPAARTLTPQEGRVNTPPGQAAPGGTPGPKFATPQGTPGPRLATPLGAGPRTPTPQGSMRRPPTMMPLGHDSDRPRKGSAELDPEKSGRRIDKAEMERLKKMEKEKAELERIARLGNENDARAAINAIARGEDYWETFGSKPRHEVMMFLAAVQQVSVYMIHERSYAAAVSYDM